MPPRFLIPFAWLFFLGCSPPAPPQLAPEEPEASRLDSHGDPLPEGAVVRLGTERLCQQDVTFLTFSPDGSKLAAGSLFGLVRVWDTATGKGMYQWQFPRDMSFYPSNTPLAFSPDGQLLALGCPEKALRVWDLTTGREVLKVAQAGITAVAFSPKGTAIAAAIDKQVRLLDTRSGEELKHCGGWNLIDSVAFSRDGKTLVGVGHDKEDRTVLRIHVWDVDSAKERGTHILKGFSPTFSRLSPDGQILAIRDQKEGTLRRWDTATGKEVEPAEGPARDLTAIAFSGDGKTLTAGSKDGRFRLWDSSTGKLLRQFVGRAGPVGPVALSADGKTLAVATQFGQAIHFWDVEGEKELRPLAGHRTGPLAVAFAPDGQSVLTASLDSSLSHPPRPGADWSLRRWDFRTGKEIDVLRQDQKTEVRHAVFSRDGRFFAVANSSGLLRLINAATFKEEAKGRLPTKEITIKTGDNIQKFESLDIHDLELSPDGSTVATTLLGKVILWDRATGKQLREVARLPEAVTRCCYFPDGQSLLVSQWAGPKYVLAQVDVQTGKELRSFPGIKDLGVTLAVSPGGQTFVMNTGPRLGLLGLYEMLSGKPRWTVDLGAGPFRLAFTPDGRLLATSGRDGAIRFWDACTGRLVQTVTGHEHGISSLAFSPDGRWLITSAANTALVWDVEAVLQGKKPAPPKLTEGDLETLWFDLGWGDPQKASAAMGRLADGGEAAVTFLLPHMLSPSSPSEEQIAGWIAGLGSDPLEVREKATVELERAGDLAEPALKKALAKPPSGDAERRMQKLLAALPCPPAAQLQVSRALEVLELIGDKAARQALQRLAEEGPRDGLGGQARLALKRLERRP